MAVILWLMFRSVVIIKCYYDGSATFYSSSISWKTSYGSAPSLSLSSSLEEDLDDEQLDYDYSYFTEGLEESSCCDDRCTLLPLLWLNWKGLDILLSLFSSSEDTSCLIMPSLTSCCSSLKLNWLLSWLYKCNTPGGLVYSWESLFWAVELF